MEGRSICFVFLPYEYLLEALFLRSWDFTVFLATASISTLEWSPIQVLTMAQVAKLQRGIAIAIYCILYCTYSIFDTIAEPCIASQVAVFFSSLG